MYSIPFIENQTGHLNGNFFTVHRIICIGRNYHDHAVEMGHDPQQEPPFFFYKPLTALNLTGQLKLPNYSNDVHYELELVLAVTKGGSNITSEQAERCLGGYALGLDMTCRDTQKKAKEDGRPWDLAKGFDGSAPVTPLVQGSLEDMNAVGDMWLKHNDHQVQHDNWRRMTWSPAELLQTISRYTEIRNGDLIFTGTPAGVGSVQANDDLEANADGFPHPLKLHIRT